MKSLTLAQANQIVDNVSALAESGRFLQPVAVSEVGASSILEVLTALYFVTAETFQNAALNSTRGNQEMLQRFVRSAGSTGVWIVTQFYSDAQRTGPVGVHESVRHTETIDSFVKFLRSIDPTSNDYWNRIYARVST